MSFGFVVVCDVDLAFGVVEESGIVETFVPVLVVCGCVLFCVLSRRIGETFVLVSVVCGCLLFCVWFRSFWLSEEAEQLLSSPFVLVDVEWVAVFVSVGESAVDLRFFVGGSSLSASAISLSHSICSAKSSNSSRAGN